MAVNLIIIQIKSEITRNVNVSVKMNTRDVLLGIPLYVLERLIDTQKLLLMI